MRARANAEALAETGREAVATGAGCLIGRLILVGFADAAQCGETLFDAGVVHAASVEVTCESVAVAALGGIGGSAVGCDVFGVFGIFTFWMVGILSFLGWVEVDTAGDGVRRGLGDIGRK